MQSIFGPRGCGVEGLGHRHPGSQHEGLRFWNSFTLRGATWPAVSKKKLFFNLHVVDKSGAGNACVNAKSGRKTSQVLICGSLAAGVDLNPKCA